MASNSYEMKKNAPVVSHDEVQWLIDMGLGRGVDATKVEMWKEKSSFQIQSISKSLDNIIGTNEGGERNYFEREISSITSRQTQLKLSVEEPHNLVEIGVDAAYSKSVSKSRTSVGEEVATRTISFRTTFDDLPLEHIGEGLIQTTTKFASAKPQQSLTSVDEHDGSSEVKTGIVKSFEEQLSDWLLKCLHTRGEVVKSTGHGGAALEDTDSSTAKLANFLYKCSEKTHESIVNDCHSFIKQTGVTHYIHSIKLGAKRFRVLTKSELAKKVGAQGKVGMEKIAKSSVSHTSTWSKKTCSLNVKEIGKITDGQVNRGVGDEAVISFKVMPIHILIRSHHVNEAMKKALRNYMIERSVESSKYIYIFFTAITNQSYVHFAHSAPSASLEFAVCCWHPCA